VNHAFKGIYVEAPGTYRVSFSYWPRGLTVALVLSGVGLAVLLAALALATLGRVRRPAPA